jgi:hypothetical protein
MRDPFGVERAKGTFAVLIRVMAGILAPTMECWQRGLKDWVASGVVGRDADLINVSADKSWRLSGCENVSFAQAHRAQSAPP